MKGNGKIDSTVQQFRYRYSQSKKQFERDFYPSTHVTTMFP